MLRISDERLGEATVVHVAGRLAGEGVDELGRLCAALPHPLRIDLTELLHADELGLSLLRALRDSGAELEGVSPFLHLMLEEGRNHVRN